MHCRSPLFAVLGLRRDERDEPGALRKTTGLHPALHLPAGVHAEIWRISEKRTG